MNTNSRTAMQNTADMAAKEWKDYYLEQVTGLVVIDMKGIIRYVNQQCVKFFEAERAEDLIGKPIQIIFPETKMLENLAPGITEPQIVFYKSEKGLGLSAHIPLMQNGKKIGLMEYDLLQEEEAFYELTDRYNAFLTTELNKLNKRLVKLEGSKYTIDNLVGSSEAMENLKLRIRRIARSNSTVLIRGETGTGKELIAHSIHNLSQRRNKVFAKVNASAFPANLVESELFGYEKGAFTGANKNGKIGKFEYANGGTLFIDEIHQMGLTVQPKLLRALQEHEIEPIGSNASIPVDVRIITAANTSLEEMVKNGEFREDLYYRLNVVTIEAPPLRHHLEDIPEIADAHIQALNKEMGMSIEGIAPDAIELLQHYHWPGNVRELKNAIERAMNFCRSHTLNAQDFSFLMQRRRGRLPQGGLGTNPIKDAKDQTERSLIEETLLQFHNNKTRAAEYLNISRSLLYQKMHRLGIK
ncbi:MAG: sigma-54 interaction domain-containing protein [Anaerovoracaceae bacterium]|jgi:transcriptional regulator with PAS, ATPase and Fis domain